jgi:succinate dehydrogenase / fumarate reductase membrane anchor subunit
MNRSPLGSALGLGSAKEGVGHWVKQRFTGIALIPLVLYVVFAIACLPQADYGTAIGFVGNPFNAIVLIALSIAGFTHAALGLQMVIEDYVSGHFAKFALLVFVKLATLLCMIASVFAVVKIALSV